MTKTRDLSDFLIEGGADLPLGKPHIVPGVLQPALAGKLLNGANHSGAYGTPQTQSGGDGHSYYYTDIKGSKPIKDPRIGAYFGSQRHKFKSIQKLEQETATEGVDVYSVDGREWMRARGDSWVVPNNANGNFLEPSNRLKDTDSQFIEIVGYFNDANILHWASGTTHDQFGVVVNGGTRQNNDLAINVAPPLSGRYVDSGSVSNLDFHSSFSGSLGINTLRISNTTGAYFSVFGIELIAQDTSNRNNIQIPSQNVVSFGKKFNVSGTPHYDPFNGFTSGNLSAVQALGIDTDTSLGLSKWLPSDAATTYYRPFNGGRIIKWVDSSGTIKTSVNMMPPNAKSIANSASPTNAFATRTTASHFGTNNAMNSFEAGTDLDSDQLSEVATTFHFREFGNGNANGGAAGTYKDASMLDDNSRDIVYVMDDGLTSLSGDNVTYKSSKDLGPDNANDTYSITFIGTGVGKTATQYPTNYTLVQNLPYGTHVLKVNRQDDNGGDPDITIDGVTFTPNVNDYGYLNELTIYQPKRPPIPEDACVIADYMLMADYVELSSITGTDFTNKISKGVRRISGTRDVFVDASSSTGMGNVAQGDVATMGPWGMYSFYSPSGSVDATVKLPFFGSKFFTWAEGTTGYASSSNYAQSINSTSLTITAQNQVNGTSSPQHLDALTNNSSEALGNNVINHTQARGQFRFVGFDLQTPIHTSSHYQPFETPFLKELVGGDRNMEQHNLVVSPDGKTWDQITRDTSYTGNVNIVASRDGGDFTGSAQAYIYDLYRGEFAAKYGTQKNFAIAYDRFICLVDGYYKITSQKFSADLDRQVQILKNTIADDNAKTIAFGRTDPANHTIFIAGNTFLKRGDYIAVRFDGATFRGGSAHYTFISIEKL